MCDPKRVVAFYVGQAGEEGTSSNLHQRFKSYDAQLLLVCWQAGAPNMCGYMDLDKAAVYARLEFYNAVHHHACSHMEACSKEITEEYQSDLQCDTYEILTSRVIDLASY
jgi:hypothetical protein